MRLKYAPGSFVRIFCGSFQCGGNLRGVVGIVIDYSDTAYFSLVLETAVCARKVQQTFLNGFSIHAGLDTKRNGRECVGYIVNTRHSQGEMSDELSVSGAVKGWMGKFVKDDILCFVFCGSI